MQIHDIEQYSDEWWALRKGRFTASMAGKIITPTGRESTQYKAEIGRLIAEGLGLQEPEEFAGTEWMQRGSELEQEARAWFSFDRGLDVKPVGIITVGDYLSASPDGVTGYMPQPIPCEFKVPKPSTHIKWLLAGGLPSEHAAQVHFQMAVMDAPFAYFMSYHPELEPLVEKVMRDEFTDKLQLYIEKAVDELKTAYTRFSGGVDGEV